MSKTPPILNLDEVALEPHGHGQAFEAQLGAVGKTLGTDKLGCTLVVVAPGKKAWPYHLHHANEELFVILAGEGTLRYDGTTYPLRAGDVVAALAGPGTAHQISNSGSGELRYLAISTMEHPEVAEYPDSGKIAAIAGAAPGRRPYPLFFIARQDAAIDYWEGEAIDYSEGED